MLHNELISHRRYTDFLKCSLKLLPQNGMPQAKIATHVFEAARAERRFLKTLFNTLNSQTVCEYVPMYKDIQQRHAQTIDAIKRGCDYIFNAFFVCDNKVASINLLRKVAEECSNSVCYQVVLVTEADEITRDHLVELHWNYSIASDFITQPLQSAGFLNRRLSLQLVDLGESLGFYNKLITDADASFSAYENNNNLICTELSPWCYSCIKRYICIPTLIKQRPPSILSAVTPSRSRFLRENNIHNIDMLNALSDDALMALNFDVFDIRNIREQCQRISERKPVFRVHLKKDYFGNVVFVSLQLARQNEVLFPRKILFSHGAEAFEITLHYDADTKSIGVDADEVDRFNSLFKEKIVTHGLDALWLKRLSTAHGIYNTHIIDLADFVAQFVHMPLLGLELNELKYLLNPGDMVLHSIGNIRGAILSPYERLILVKELVNYFVKYMY
ncbi:MAG TPA: hypothetical protein PLK75_00540 [Bacteroidales bacterium]|nr:hypothetical protein [Bacteroidales bacterium]